MSSTAASTASDKPSILQYDWREAPAPDEVLYMLQNIFVHVGDPTIPKKTTQPANSKSKKAYTLERVDDGGFPDVNGNRSLVLRHSVPYMRPFKSSSDKLYWAKWLLVLEECVIRTSHRSHEAQRLSQYKTQRKSFSRPESSRILADLATSVGVAVRVLGAIPTAKGMVSVPRFCGMSAKTATNIHRYLEMCHAVGVGGAKGGVGIDTFGSAFAPVQSTIVSVALEEPPDLVFVCEHRNIMPLIQKLRQQADSPWNRYIIVLTGGFADSATCEFLSLLSKHPDMRGVPFVFMSDHDPHAVQIFLTIKYGSKHAAHLSNSQACSVIKWLGPEASQLTDVIADSADGWIRDQLKLNKNWTSAEARKRQTEWITDKTAAKDIHLKHDPGAKLTRIDKSLIKGWRNLGLLDHEPRIADTAERWLRDGFGKFRLSYLQRIQHKGLENYMNRVFDDLLSHEYTIAESIPEPGSATQRFNNLDSSLGLTQTTYSSGFLSPIAPGIQADLQENSDNFDLHEEPDLHVRTRSNHSRL